VTVAQKAIASFLVSALLAGGIACLAYIGVFDLIEYRFYNPAASEALIREAARDARLLGGHLSDLQDRFLSALSVCAVRRSFLPTHDEQDVYERSRLFGELLKSIPSLYSVRFVDSAGRRIFFSTHPADIAGANTGLPTYRGYNEDPASLPFGEVYVPARERGKLTLDTARDRVVFSFPLYDSLDVHRGVALFTVSARALAEAFAASGRRGVGENIVFVADPAGFVDTIPGMSGEEIIAGISSAWTGGYRSVVPFVAPDATFVLVSVPMEQGFYFGRIVNEAAMNFSGPVKRLVLTAIFLTLFLIVFFLFNFRQDSAMVRAHDGSCERKPVKLPPGGVMPKKAGGDGEELEELETVDDAPEGRYAGPKAVSPFVSTFSSLGDVGGNSGKAAVRENTPAKAGNRKAVHCEVIVEHGGVPYINGNAVGGDKSTAEKLDGNFVKLVKSVVGGA
jgi:hypothetical protein